MTDPSWRNEVTPTLEWLRESLAEPAVVFYHGDADGCVSAAYWAELLTAKGISAETRKILTAELGFERVSEFLDSRKPRLSVFLDVAAGTQFGSWSGILTPDQRILVYDHHQPPHDITQYEPRLLQIAYERSDALPPTCVFSHECFKAITGNDPNWLVAVGLMGEGRQKHYPTYMTGWRHVRPLTRLIVYGVLREDDAALRYLRHYLSAGREPPDPARDPEARELRLSADEIEALVRSSADRLVAGAQGQVITGVIQSPYPIANYVASAVKGRRRDAVVVVGESSGPGLLRAELRTGPNRSEDLRAIISEAKDAGLLLGGGGHHTAVGARLTNDRWEQFVRLIEASVADGG